MINQDNNVWENKTVSHNGELVRETKPKTSTLDINFKRVLSVWPFVILFAVLGLVGGYIYLRYVDVVYNVSTSINIEQREEVSIGQAFFGSSRDPFNDKIAYFKSPSLIIQLVDKLGLQYHSEARGRFKDKDFYGLINWKILNSVPDFTPDITFTITPKGNSFNYKYGDTKGN